MATNSVEEELKYVRKELSAREADFSKLRDLAERLMKAIHVANLHKVPSIQNQVSRLRSFLKSDE